MIGMTISPFKPSIEEYLAQRDEEHAKKYKHKLLEDARRAIGWGVPDRESTGYSQRELVNIIYELVRFIERNT